MPNPSASRPSHRSRHGIANRSAHASSGAERGVGHATEEAGSATQPPLRRARLQATAVAPAARDRELGVGQPGDGVDEHVESLARHQPAHPDHEGPLVVEPERLPHREALGGVDRAEAIDVDSGRDDDAGEPLPRGPDRFARGVLARGDDARGAVQHASTERA